MTAGVGSPFGSPEPLTRAAAGALRLITAGQVIGTVQVTHNRQESHGGPADETVQSGIGGTDYQIELSDRSRIPASTVQQCQSRPGKTVPAAWRIADPNQSPVASQRRAVGKAARARTSSRDQ